MKYLEIHLPTTAKAFIKRAMGKAFLLFLKHYIHGLDFYYFSIYPIYCPHEKRIIFHKKNHDLHHENTCKKRESTE